MNNLEQQIIKRLNSVLNKYNLDIVNGSNINDNIIFSDTNLVLKYSKEYNNDLLNCIYFWTSVDDMLFAEDNIFKYLINRIEPSVNIFHCAGASLEEIIIRMDLMGI